MVIFSAGILTFAWALLAVSRTGAQQPVSFNRVNDRIEVQIGDQPFTTLRVNEFPKPILYPVFAPGQIPLTRGYPIEELPGEARDHVHHKSVWFAHGDVNGVDFWSEKSRIRTDGVSFSEAAGEIIVDNSWLDGETKLIADETRIRFGVDGVGRWIDWDVSLTACDKPIRFGDTKEGTFGIRTHPQLRLSANKDDPPDSALGHAVNSEGDLDKSIWGKRAKWVLYFGPVGGREVGIVIMDHPQNLRHPTTWHAREYGLIAVNPFGLHDFLGEPAGSGDFLLNKSETLRLIYRVVFFQAGDSLPDCHALFNEFAKTQTGGERPK